MAFCSKCGIEIPDGAGFCHVCGMPLAVTNDARGEKAAEVADEDVLKTKLRNKPVYGIVNLGDLPKGHIFDERYEVKEKLGQGGFGTVYLAYDRKMEIDKALKVLPESIVNDVAAMKSIKVEATTMVKLDHPNIVRVFDFQDKGSVKYIDMQFVDGSDLTKIRFQSEDEKLPEAEVKKYGIQIAKGLSYAHSKNVIHKDIKPQNILLSKTAKIKIMDFGISETVSNSMSRVENSSSSGTLLYMSPEQIRGVDVGKEADVYSFGVLLYELLSGNPPFYKGDISYQVINEEPALIDSISEEMNQLLQKCLAKDYKERFRNFDEVLKALSGDDRSFAPEKKEAVKLTDKGNANGKNTLSDKAGRITPVKKERAQATDTGNTDGKDTSGNAKWVKTAVILSVVVAIVVALFALSGNSKGQSEKEQTITELRTPAEKLGYAIGSLVGINIKKADIFISLPAFNQGYRDFITDATLLLTLEEMVLVTEEDATRRKNKTDQESKTAANSGDSGERYAKQKKGKMTVLNTHVEKLGYTLGYELAKSCNIDGYDMAFAPLMQGVEDGITGGRMLLSPEEVESIKEQAIADMKKKQASEKKAEGEKKLNEGEQFLAENRKKEGVIVTPSGLQYKILTKGRGAFPTTSDKVKVHYSGSLVDGAEFDSSYKRGKPAVFNVSGVIAGWVEALLLMPVGSKWRLFIPSKLAYGSRGAGTVVGPNAMLIFDVELLAIEAE